MHFHCYSLDLPEKVREKGTRLTDKQKLVQTRTKERIQREFMRDLHLAVDKPKAGILFTSTFKEVW